jgi:MYXO-CTERM domain-containing protein
MICFYVDCPAGSNLGVPVSSGHAFVQFVPMNNGAGPSTRGFYPNSWNLFGGAGIIKNDAGHAWDCRVCYNVTPAQYNAAVAVSNARTTTPGNYNLLSRNCVDFCSSVAAAAGITLPTTVGVYGASDPATFWASLDAVKNHGAAAPPGGTVSGNPGGAVAANPPRDFTPAGVGNTGHMNPATLASNTNLPLDQFNLGGVNSNSTTGLTINLTGLNSSALVSVNWGDNTPWNQQSSAFNHVYAPGSYTADVLVVDSGAVHDYSMNVSVSPSPGALVGIGVNHFPDAGGNNPTDYPDGTSIPDETPAPSAAALLALGGLVIGRRRR